MAKRLTKIDWHSFVSQAREGNLAEVQAYLDRNIPPDVRDLNGITALAAVTKNDSIGRDTKRAIASALVNAGANPNIVITDESDRGRTYSALHEAAYQRDWFMIDLLLELGANPRVLNGHRYTPAHSLLLRPISDSPGGEQPLCNRLEKMLELGVPINQRTEEGSTLLGLALAMRAPTTVVSWLMEHGADIHSVAENGSSALYAAAGRGNLEAIRLFAGLNVPVNGPNELGRTPLFSGWRKNEVGEELLALGADIEHRDIYGRTALGDALEDRTVVGRIDKAAFLIFSGANVDAADYEGMTPRKQIEAQKLLELSTLINASSAKQTIMDVVRKARTPRPTAEI